MKDLARMSRDELEEECAFLRGELFETQTREQNEKMRRRWGLTLQECRILAALYSLKGRVATKTQLFDMAWEFDSEADIKIIDVFICKLRKKLAADWIGTVWGIGYQLKAAGIAEVARILELPIDQIEGVDADARMRHARDRTTYLQRILERLAQSAADTNVLAAHASYERQRCAALCYYTEGRGLIVRTRRAAPGRVLAAWDITPKGRQWLRDRSIEPAPEPEGLKVTALQRVGRGGRA